VPEEVATLRLTAKDETAAAFQAAALNLHRVKTATDDFHRSNQAAFERGKRSIELFGVSLEKALAIGTIAEFGRRAYETFADFDRAMTMTRLNTGATQEQMARLSETIEELQKTTRQTNEQLIAGFNTYMQTSGQTFEQAMAMFPKIAATATATQNDINSVATAIGAAARNLHLTTAQQTQALDQLALAASKNLKDLGQYLPELTNALRGMGASGPEAFQSILSALMTIRGGFGSTAEAVQALEQAIRAVTQSRDKGFAAMGREIERRVKEGQDFVVAMMQTLEANNMLTDQALRRFLGRGGPALLALQQLRDLWQQNRANFEALGRAQGEVERRNRAIQQDAKAAAEALSVAFHNVLDEVGKFLAVSGVPKALTDTADALHTANSLIAQIREGVEGKGLDWEKFLGTSGLEQQFEHFMAVWRLRWQRLKDFLLQGTTPGGRVGAESEEARRLQQEVDRLEGNAPRRRWHRSGAAAVAPRQPRTITGRPYYFSGGGDDGGEPIYIPWSGGSNVGLEGEPMSGNIEDRRARDEVIDALHDVTTELKRLNDFYEAERGGAGGGGIGPGAYAGGGGGGAGGRTGSPWFGGPAGRGVPGGAPGPGIPADTGLGPGTGGPAAPGAGVSMAGVHPDLVSAVEEGAKYGLPAGYTWKWISGVRTGGRAGSYHHAGMAPGGYGGAGDIQIFDPQGRAIPNVGTGPGYSLYERFALAVRATAQRRGMPFTWGGHFRSGVPYDLMHMQYGGPSRFGFDPARVQQEIDRQVGLGANRGLASQLGAESGPLAGIPGDQAATNVANFMTGISFLETSLDPRQAAASEAGNTGFFRMNAADAAKARAAGLPDPRHGSFQQQAAANWQYIQRFFPSAAGAIKRGDFMGAARQLGKFWVSMPGSGQQQQSAARYQRWWNIVTGRDPLSAQVRRTAQEAARGERREQAGGGEDEESAGRLTPDVAEIPKNVADLRAALEKPIRMHIEAPEAPSRFVPRVRRASAANVQNAELHRERERAYVDMEE
jgi:CII-binding regulator of phage lambda lysogenization HflD